MDRPRLLVVDDDSYTRNALSQILGGRGWQVLLAGTVAEGLALLDAAPSFVILDLNLPDGCGEAILRAVRSRSPRVRVAVCSASEDAGRLAVVRNLRPELMLWKPIDLAPVFRLSDEALAASA